MTCGIIVLDRVIISVAVPIQALRVSRVREGRIRLGEGGKQHRGSASSPGRSIHLAVMVIPCIFPELELENLLTIH